jgi:hypothetical protein
VAPSAPIRNASNKGRKVIKLGVVGATDTADSEVITHVDSSSDVGQDHHGGEMMVMEAEAGQNDVRRICS